MDAVSKKILPMIAANQLLQIIADVRGPFEWFR
jgi:hypothetical protein